MRFGSVCSGIEAASVAWEPLGWKAAWLAEIEKFPAAVLAHHYPDTPNLGDMTTIARSVLAGDVEAPDVLCGGTPCQAFSVAGLRESLADERGNLTLKFVELADAIDHVRAIRGSAPSIVFWENVPGVLSTKDNAFGCFLAGLAGEDDPLQPPGERWANAGAVYGPTRAIAWRTLDAQYFGLAQRRRRVFVVASAREGFDPAKVLFEWDGMRRDSAPSRDAGPHVAALTANGVGTCGADDNQAQAGHLIASTGPVSHCLNAGGMGRIDYETETMVVHGTQDPCVSGSTAFALGRNNGGENAVCVTGTISHTLRAEGFDASEDGTGRGQPIVAVSLRGREGGATAELGDEVQNCLRASGGGGDKAHVLAPHTAFSAKDFGADATVELSPTLRAGGSDKSHANSGNWMAIQSGMAVRRLTPTECARLQGFPDDYLDITYRGKPAADGPKYKALGNSWAVPVVRWIGERIQEAA